MKKRLFTLLLAVGMLSLFTSCKKQEGKGGKFTIKGKVFAKFYDKDLTFKTGQGYLADHDVYIIYGDADSYGDKISTNIDGSFEFNFLRKGTYTIYTYSRDTTRSSSSGEIAVSVEVTISDDQELEDFVVVAEEKKLFRIQGKVKAEYYSLDYVTKNSEGYLGDQDVFAVNAANPYYSVKATTNNDGSYEFRNLPKGDYKIYTFYNDFMGTTSAGDVEVSKDTTVVNSSIVMPDLVVKKEDEKRYTVTGKIRLIEIDGSLVVIDQYYAGDIDVYIIYGNGTVVGDRVRSSFDGTYQFNLPNGQYTIFAYSDDETGLNQHPIHKSINVTVNNGNVTLNDLTIYD